MPGVGINVAITGDATGLKGALSDAEGGMGKLGGAMNALPMVAVAGAALGVAVAIGDMTKAAAEDRAEQEKLNAIYVAAGAATDGYTEAINTAIEAGRGQGVQRLRGQGRTAGPGHGNGQRRGGQPAARTRYGYREAGRR